MSLGSLLFVVLILMLFGVIPTWPHSKNCGYYHRWWTGTGGAHPLDAAVARMAVMGQRPASVKIAHWRWRAPWIGVAALTLAACGDIATLPVAAGTGPQPTLPPPQPTLIPTVNIAPAKGWPPGTTPLAAAGMQVTAFASGLDHPRWLLVLPNGDVLVAETNAPPKPEDGQGIKGG